MRHLVYTRPGHVEWQEARDPELADDTSVLVQPLAVSRCDLDLPMARDGLFPGPYPVGHEIAGRVVATGGRVRDHRAGDTVIVPFQLSCGRCGPCRRGTFAACATYMAPVGGSFGFGSWGGGHGGGLADLLAVPDADHLLLAAPPGVPAVALATLSDNVVDGYRAVGPALAERPGAEVLIVAAAPGALALYTAAAAIALGAARVRYVDRDPARAEAARQLGADSSHHGGPWPKRFDPAPVTVDVTGDADGLACVIRSTERYGVCTGLAIAFEAATPLPLLEMYTRGITFHTSRADARRYLPDVLRLLATTGFNPMAVPTTIRPWEEAPEAWLQPAVKLVVERERLAAGTPSAPAR
jgi:threonine dehydrogenase-like Zn-dependent dehydrogenase